MVVTALGLLLGGRADTGAVRTGASAGARRGRRPRRRDCAGVRGGRRGGRRRGRGRPGACWPATSPPRAGRAPSSAAPRCPVSALAELAEPLVAVHGQSDQHRLLQPRAQRDALDRFGGEPVAAAAGDVRRAARRAARDRARARRGGRRPPASGPGRPTCCGSASARSRRSTPRPGEDAALAAEEARLGLRRHAAHRRRAGPRGAVQRRRATPTRSAAVAAARTLLDGVREHDAEAGELADRLAELTYLLSDVAADVASYAAGLETDPARLAAVSERRAALTALTRKYGETVDEVLAWAETSAAAAARPRRHRRADRPAARASATTLRAELGAGRRRAVRRPARDGRRPARPPRSPASSTLLAMPHAVLEVAVARHDAEPDAAGPRLVGGRWLRFGSSGRRRGRAPARRQHRLRAAAARTRARRAASCPG